jgi:hypothetical protein
MTARVESPVGWATIVALAMNVGCARTSSHPLMGAELAQLQSQLDGRRTTVWVDPAPAAASQRRQRSFSGRTYLEGRQLRVVESEERVHHLRLADVREIEPHDTGTGAVLGALAGLVAGAAAGGIYGYARSDKCSKDKALCFNRPQSAVLFGLTGAAVGALLGLPVGTAVGAGPSWTFSSRFRANALARGGLAPPSQSAGGSEPSQGSELNQ